MSEAQSGAAVWERRLDDGNARLESELGPADLAERFGDDPERVEAITSEAFMEAMRAGATVMTMAHFESAAENLDGDSDDGDPEGTVDESGPSPEVVAEVEGAGREDDDVPSATDVSIPSSVDPDAPPVDEGRPSQDAGGSESVEQSDATGESPAETAVGQSDESEVTPSRDDLEERVAELEAENEELRQLVEGVQSQLGALQGKLSRLTQLTFGDREFLSYTDVDAFDDILTRTQGLEDHATELDQQVAMVRTDGAAGTDDPDSRARYIRQTLLNQARENDGKAKMTRDAADSRLGGGLNRDRVLDAMRRAADGHAADINGASDLQPVESITFHVGEGRGQQSELRMDLEAADGPEIRQQLTSPTDSDSRRNQTTKDRSDGG